MKNYFMQLAAFLAIAFAPISRAENPAIQPDDVFKLETASDPQIRPQGDVVAYVRRAPDVMSDRIRGAIWLIDARTGVQTPFATGAGTFGEPRWSPEGTRLAYISSTEGSSQIYVAASDGSHKTKITSLEQSPSNITWSPDGTRIAFSMFVAGKRESFGATVRKPVEAQWAPPVEVNMDEGYRYDSAGYVPPGTNQLFIVPAQGGKVTRVTHADEFGVAFNPPSWSADGRNIVYSSIRGLPWNTNYFRSEIVSVDVASGALSVLTHREGPDESPAFSPDGQWIAYVGFDDRRRSYENRQLYLMRPDGSDAHSITEALDQTIETFRWEKESRSLLIAYVDHGAMKLSRVTLGKEARKTAIDELPAHGFDGEFSPSNAGAIAYTFSDSISPSGVSLLGGKDVRQLLELNGELLSRRTLADFRELPVTAPDGKPVQAWMMTPRNANPAKKLPLILVIHGGPFSAYWPDFSFEFQRYTAAGYAVVYANPRGSTSYGADFANEIDKKFPGPDYADLMAVVDAAIDTGRIDANNLFVTGASYGGVMTGWIVGSTKRFKAAVMQRPITNMISATLGADQAGYLTHFWFEKYPWEDVDAYWKRSPLSLVGNVETPTMLIVGTEDYRTPESESDQYFTALRLRGIPTALLRVPGAAHQTMTARPSQNAQRIEAIIAWFNKYRH